MKKKLSALKHYFMGYELHPKERMRLYDLWLDFKVSVLTILVLLFMIWLIDASGCTHEHISL